MSQTPNRRDAEPHTGCIESHAREHARRNVEANQQWGGRFAAGPSVVMQEINASIGFDKRLWRQDIKGSLAHAAMLAKVGVISARG